MPTDNVAFGTPRMILDQRSFYTSHGVGYGIIRGLPIDNAVYARHRIKTDVFYVSFFLFFFQRYVVPGGRWAPVTHRKKLS